MSDPTRQGLAEIGRISDEIDLQGEDRLFQALVSGCHVENAATIAGISERTAYRRLADPEFRNQLAQSLRESILARLADSGHDAISTLSALIHDSETVVTKKTLVNEEKGFEESLWDSANRLRRSVESSEYEHVVLSLIFLKFVSDKFEERRAALITEGKQAYTDMVEFYAMQNVFYLPETSRWSHIQSLKFVQSHHGNTKDISVYGQEFTATT